MRDPNRIDRVIEKLRTAWKAQPDMRLGQLLVNVSRPCPQMFGVEDTFTEKQLDEYPNPTADRYTESEVTLGLSKAEALVLFAFVTRFSETDKLKIEHPAEARVLWDVCCLLEKQLVPEQFGSIWSHALAEARERVQSSSNE